MKTRWVALAVLLALVLQTAIPLTRLPLLGRVDFFIIIMVLFACRLPSRHAYAACAIAGLFKDAFSCFPFGVSGLLGLLTCAVLLRLKRRLIVERVGCRFLLLVVAVLVEELGGVLLLRLLCGLEATLQLVPLVSESLAVAVTGTLFLSALAVHNRRRRLRLAAV